MKVALIGSGIAAAGVLDGLSQTPNVAVTLIEEAGAPLAAFEARAIADAANDDWRKALYAELRRAHGLKFPPPKTHFGAVAGRIGVDNWGSIWTAPGRGGLSNFWGGSALAPTKRDLRSWPIAAEALAPYYQRAATRVGVSGRTDALSPLFSAEHITRPPIELPPLMRRLESALSDAPAMDGARVTTGIARLALETRPDRPAFCRHEGACMIGCRYGAIYTTRHDIDGHKAAGLIETSITARVLEISTLRTIRISDPAGVTQWIGPFDRIYLAAGCPGSTEITMRSLGLNEGPAMSDNAVLSFPIFYTGNDTPHDQGRYFGLTNLLMLCESDDQPDALVQIYPAFDHLWRYYGLAGVGDWMRQRMMIARLYLHGSLSQTYSARLGAGGACHWALSRAPAPFHRWRGVWDAIQRALNRQGFWTPPIRPLAQRTSSHYAGTFPLGGGTVDAHGQFLPGAFVCDSTVFPDAPAASPSLTSFALACRAARESL